jgi:hypothetical protein
VKGFGDSIAITVVQSQDSYLNSLTCPSTVKVEVRSGVFGTTLAGTKQRMKDKVTIFGLNLLGNGKLQFQNRLAAENK